MTCLPISLKLPFSMPILQFIVILLLLVFYLWTVQTPCTHLMYYMYVYDSVRYSLLDDTECRGPVYCIAHTMCTRSILPFGIQYTGIYFQHCSWYILLYIIRFQDFTLCSISGLLIGRGTAGIQYVARRVFHSSMLQYFQVPCFGYTLSPRHSWPSVVL